MLREETGATRVVHIRHVCGVFERAAWRRLLEGAGFRPRVHDTPWDSEVFAGTKPG